MFRRCVIAVLAAAVLSAGCAADKPVTTGQGPPERYRGEAPPSVTADQVAPPELLSGAGFSVDSDAPVRDYNCVFTVRTEYGPMKAHGVQMLRLRVAEMAALDRLLRLARNSNVPVESVASALTGSVRGVVVTLDDPAGTVGHAAEQFSVQIREVLDPSDRRAGPAFRRRLAVACGADPETNNPLLKGLLDRMSREKKITEAVVGALPGGGAVLALGELGNRPTADAVAAQEPHVLNAAVERQLVALGVDAGTAARFTGNLAFTTVQRMALVGRLSRMKGVSGLGATVAAAAEAPGEARALGLLAIAATLAAEHERSPLQAVTAGPLPHAIRNDGSRLIVVPADFLHDTDEVRRAIADYRSAVPDAPTEALLLGRLTPAARRMLEAASIAVRSTRKESP